MPKWPDLAAGFKLLREVDLNAIRRQAELPFHLAVLGREDSGRSLLISQLLSGPRLQEIGLYPGWASMALMARRRRAPAHWLY